MAIKLGDSNISKIMLGDRPIKKVMLGDRLVWESYKGNIIKETTIHEISEEEWQEILNQRQIQAENEEDSGMVQNQ